MCFPPMVLKTLVFYIKSTKHVPNVVHCSPNSRTINYNISLCITLRSPETTPL